MKKFKLDTLKYTLIITALFEAGSIPVLKFSPEYLCGLMAGAAVSVAGFYILLFISERVLSSGQRWLSSLGYLVRLPIYGAVFFICLKIGGLIAGVACLIGFLTGMIALIVVQATRAKAPGDKKTRREAAAEFEREEIEKEEMAWKS